MDKQSEDVFLEAKLNDAVRLAQNGGRPRFVGFLDERQARIAENRMARIHFENYMLFGGQEDAERVVFGAFPDFLEPDAGLFPISAVTACFRSCDRLGHRDFMGAILATGIQREALGDILLETGRCVFFVRSEISDFLLSQISKIGKVGVTMKEGAEEPLPPRGQFANFSAVVASPRLDCIVAAVVGTSREKSCEMIRAGMVMLNHEEILSVSAAVTPGSKLSVRGKGRFVLDRLGPVTKKGRLSIAGRKYI
ncbi:MAG: YlmH-RBD domain-containing protein [Eubacteriales bacterium]|jgi:RNA-binding protein YlmH